MPLAVHMPLAVLQRSGNIDADIRILQNGAQIISTYQKYNECVYDR